MSMQVFGSVRNRLKLDVIKESPKGGDDSSNSSKVASRVPPYKGDDELNQTKPLDESNLLDDLEGIPDAIDNIQDISAFEDGNYEFYRPGETSFADLAMEQVSILLEREKTPADKPNSIFSPVKLPTSTFGEGEPTQGFGGKQKNLDKFFVGIEGIKDDED